MYCEEPTGVLLEPTGVLLEPTGVLRGTYWCTVRNLLVYYEEPTGVL